MNEDEPVDGWHSPAIPAHRPRSVRPTQLVHSSRTGFLVGAIAIVLIALFFALRTIGALVKLRDSGRQTEADIVGRGMTGGRSRSYFLYYTFSAGDHNYNDREPVSLEAFNAYAGNELFTVVYLADHPETHVVGLVTQERIDGLRNIWIGSTLGVLLFLALCYYAFETTRMKQEARLANDFALPAIVDEIGKSTGGKAPQCLVKIRYQDIAGETQSVAINLVPAVTAKLDVARPTTILMNPNNPASILFLSTITLAELAP